jgi:hypothetical protein
MTGCELDDEDSISCKVKDVPLIQNSNGVHAVPMRSPCWGFYFLEVNQDESEVHAIQVVSRWFPTTAAQVQAWIKSCGICGQQSCTEIGFLLVLQFPLPIFILPSALHSSSSIIGHWYNRPNSSQHAKWTQSYHTPRN